jgi:hypothetical protein
VRRWGIIAALSIGCAGRSSAPGAEANPLLGCESSECRAETYRSMYNAGAHALPAGGPGCGELGASGCEPLRWCRTTVVGASGNALDETSVVLLVGKDAAGLSTAVRVLERSGSVDGEIGPAALSTIRDENVGVIVLERALTGRDPIDADSLETPPESVRTQACTVVHADPCAGFLGWVCTGTDDDGLAAFEMELADLEPRALGVER